MPPPWTLALPFRFLVGSTCHPVNHPGMFDSSRARYATNRQTAAGRLSGRAPPLPYVVRTETTSPAMPQNNPSPVLGGSISSSSTTATRQRSTKMAWGRILLRQVALHQLTTTNRSPSGAIQVGDRPTLSAASTSAVCSKQLRRRTGRRRNTTALPTPSSCWPMRRNPTARSSTFQ